MGKEEKSQEDEEAGKVVRDSRYGIIAVHHQDPKKKGRAAAEGSAEPDPKTQGESAQ